MATESRIEPTLSTVIAVIPAYNEAAEVGKVVQAVHAHQLPVVVVDDGSTDSTAAEARAAGATVLHTERNLGKGAALQVGFRWALEEGAGALLTLDADGQHDPAEIPRFLEAFTRGDDDLIIGARNFDDMPWTRYTMNVLGRWTFSWVMGQPMPDNQSGYRLVSRRLALDSLESEERGYEFEVDMIVRCIEQGYTLGWVPIRTIYNDHPSHINHVKHVYQYLRLLWQVRQRLKDVPRRTKSDLVRARQPVELGE